MVEPLNSRTDESAVAGLLSAVQTVKVEREVKAAAENIEPFGLDNPKLHISFLAGGTWHNLRVGPKAVVGDNFYASGDQENSVVLISGEQQRALDKNLFDLRAKELFTLKGDEINRIEIERSDDQLSLARVDKVRWQAPTEHELKIKASKVEDLLNRLVWLRATGFLDQEQDNIAALGLDPARIRISLSDNEKQVTLLLGNTEENKTVYAKSSELPGVAMVDANLIEGLPGNLRDLEDRTFLTFDLDDLSGLTLVAAGESGRLERQDEKWKWVDDSGRNDPENWLVNALLWKIQDLEYLMESPSQEQSPPEKNEMELVLFSADEKTIGKFVVAEVPSEEAERGMVWFLKAGETAHPYFATAASLRDIYESANKLLTHES
jgi:hypothetical protein